MMGSPDTLESRIAAMLSAADAGSDAVASLIQEAETAAQQADAAAAKARADALDPTAVIDVARVSAKVTAAELTRDRLNAALPKLREVHRQAAELAYATAWWSNYETVEGELNALAAELAEVYSECVQRLMDILGRIPAMNARVDRINYDAPAGFKDRLQGVEQAARGVASFGANSLLSLMTDLKLPKFTFDDDGDRYQFHWPPWQPSLVEQMAHAGGLAIRHFGRDTWMEEVKERNRQIVAEAERAAAESEARQREREQREKAEIEALKERDRQAYRERGWPT